MDRRSFLQKAALVAAGVVAGDQLELLDRLLHKRRFFPGASFGRSIYAGQTIQRGDLVTVELRPDGKWWVVPIRGAPSNTLLHVVDVVEPGVVKARFLQGGTVFNGMYLP